MEDDHGAPDLYTVHDVLVAGALLYPTWDDPYARRLLDDFDLTLRRRVATLSRGMRSALWVVVGLAARAPLTVFDEPHVGLDAGARARFHELLLADYVAHPRTVVLSTHLIDEVGDLVERVLVLDRGHLVVDRNAEDLRGSAITVTGPADPLNRFLGTRERLRTDHVASFGRVMIMGPLSADEAATAEGMGLTVEPVSLQQFVVHATPPLSTGAAVAATAGAS